MRKLDCPFCAGTKLHSNRGTTDTMCPGFLEVRRANTRRYGRQQNWVDAEAKHLRHMKAQRRKRIEART